MKRVNRKKIKIDSVLKEVIEKHHVLANEYSQLLSVFESIEDSIYVTDMDTYEILYVNKALQGKFNEPLIGKTCYKSFQGFDAPCSFCTNSKIRDNNYQPYYWEHHNPKLNAWFHLTDKVIKWPDGRDVRFEIAVDITIQKVLEEKLRVMATTDELTGLWNRRYFMQAGKHEFERSVRYNTQFSLLMLDLDNFKRVNDNCGHAAGDEALRHIGLLIKKTLREADIPGRIGGEEFGIILPHTDIENAFVLAERLRKNIGGNSIDCDGHNVSVTVSIGATVYHKGFRDFDDMLRIADSALYQAKDNGRNCVVKKI